MNLPNLPTDNLYKFLALAGLALILISILYTQSKVWDLQIEVSELSGNVALYNFEIDRFEKEREYAEKNGLIPKDGNKMIEELRKLAEIERKSIEIKSALKTIEVKSSQIDSLLFHMYFGTGIGFIMTVSGFALWYILVQRYQDEILRI